MKDFGLNWQPHAGCFVWDPDNWIKPESPFPGRIYFVLSMPRFAEIFGSVEEMARKLVWLPTWHQARLIAERLGVGEETARAVWTEGRAPEAGEEILRLYERILSELKKA
mgnify:CR=1 FL=1